MKDRVGRLACAVAVLVAVGALGAGCGSPQASSSGTIESSATEVWPKADADIVVPVSGTPRTGGKLVYGLEADSDGLNPTTGRWAISGVMAGLAVYDPLVAFDADQRPQPYLAESLRSADDFRTWWITVRSGVTFHDGSALTSANVKQTLDALKASALTGAALRPLESVEVEDERTVRVAMNSPWAAFPTVLTGQGGVVPAPATLADPDGGNHPIGTGPFAFDDWIKGDRLKMKRNNAYWMKDAAGVSLPYLANVEFRPISDTQSRQAALLAGDVDVAHFSDNASQTRLADEARAGNLQFVTDRGESEESFVQLNVSQPPLDDVRIRRALAFAMDRDALFAVDSTPPALAADGPFEKGSRWYAETDFPEFDVSTAQELVRQYKSDHGGAPVVVTIMTNESPDALQSAQAITEMWSKIGIDARVKAVDQTKEIADAVFGDFQASAWRQFGAPDPDIDYHFWIGANAAPNGQLALNIVRFSDPVVDENLDKARASADEGVRREAYAAVQRRWAELVPYIWVSHVRWAILARPPVRAIGSNPLPDGSASLPFMTGAHRLTGMWLDT